MRRVQIICWAKSLCLGIGWEWAYWKLFNFAYDAIDKHYGSQSNRAW